MTTYQHRISERTYTFTSLAQLLARATPHRSGDVLAQCAASSSEERIAAQWALADVPLTDFVNYEFFPSETDDVTRLIQDTFDADAFAASIGSFTVGALRDWLLETATRTDATDRLRAIRWALTPEMVAAVSKLMRNQELIAVSRVISNPASFRTTIGLPGRLATRLQPNHPTDDPTGVAASVLDGLLMGAGDAVVGVNPASDSPAAITQLLQLLDEVRTRLDAPLQSCVLTHVTTTLDLLEAGAPVDVVFQSIGGNQRTNESFGFTLDHLRQADAAARQLGRGTVGSNVMYFETGQGTALSANAHLGTGSEPVDQQTMECRAYGVARAFNPLLVNTVVGFIGPEYLYDGKQIIRAGLEDNFCGKLLGLPMGVDVCYTNHAEADHDDMDTLLTLLAAAETGFVITVPGADDIMLGYQSLSFHDALYARRTHGLRPTPEFEAWLAAQDMLDDDGNVRPRPLSDSPIAALLEVAS